MPRDIKELMAEVEKHGFAIGSPIAVTGATSELFGNLQPVDLSQPLLHYMPVHRLTSLISGAAIYLRRLDLFQDKFEGRLPAANDSEVSGFTAQFMRQFGMTERDVKNWKNFLTGTNRKLTYVHCWFASDNEDVSMWRDYADGGNGVCLRTTARRLGEAISCPSHLGLELRRVTYTGEQEALPEIISCLPAGRKQARPEFIRECEVRIIGTITEEAWAAGFTTADKEPPAHQLIPVNFERLFERVYVGPNAPDTTFEKVEALANTAAGCRVVHRSSLSPFTIS
jgi:hypothetical protein